MRDPLPYGYPAVGIASPSEYAAYLSLLRRFIAAEDAGRPACAWETCGFTSIETDAWIAMARERMVGTRPSGGTWYVITVTPLGRAWLADREGGES